MPRLSWIRICSPFLLCTHESATYSWPWQNTGFGKYNPTCAKDCPRDLFMAIANETMNENCLLISLNGHGESKGDIFILDMYVVWPILGSVIISASTTLVPSLVTISRVPLHKPFAWSKLRSSMMGVPTLILSLWLGIPDVFKEFRNSGVSTPKARLSSSSYLSTLSALQYSMVYQSWLHPP